MASGVVLVLLGAGCAARSKAASPPTSLPAAAGTTAPATAPPTSIVTPPGARLAIGTSAWMELWSAATGVFTVGPTLRDVRVSDVAWSADGRDLSWQTTPAGGGRHGAELWWAQLATGLTAHWGPLPAGAGYGPVVATDAGVLTLHSTVALYAPGRRAAGTTVAVPAVTPVAGTADQSWDGGWVLEPSGSPTGQRVERVEADGGAAPAVVLDAGTSHGPYFGPGAVAAGGGMLAIGLGTQRAGCEAGGVAQLWTVALATGTVRYSTPPAPAAGMTQRFWDLDASGAPGTVYASTFACTPAGRATDTVLWRFGAGVWHRLGRDEVAADQAGSGPVATLSGAIGISHGVPAVVGGGDVDVDGRTVADGGELIAWDPVQGA